MRGGRRHRVSKGGYNVDIGRKPSNNAVFRAKEAAAGHRVSVQKYLARPSRQAANHMFKMKRLRRQHTEKEQQRTAALAHADALLAEEADKGIRAAVQEIRAELVAAEVKFVEQPLQRESGFTRAKRNPKPAVDVKQQREDARQARHAIQELKRERQAEEDRARKSGKRGRALSAHMEEWDAAHQAPPVPTEPVAKKRDRLRELADQLPDRASRGKKKGRPDTAVGGRSVGRHGTRDQRSANGEITGDDDLEDCAVCMEPTDCLTECKHPLCLECAGKVMGLAQGTCPLCRRDMLPKWDCEDAEEAYFNADWGFRHDSEVLISPPRVDRAYSYDYGRVLRAFSLVPGRYEMVVSTLGQVVFVGPLRFRGRKCDAVCVREFAVKFFQQGKKVTAKRHFMEVWIAEPSGYLHSYCYDADDDFRAADNLGISIPIETTTDMILVGPVKHIAPLTRRALAAVRRGEGFTAAFAGVADEAADDYVAAMTYHISTMADALDSDSDEGGDSNDQLNGNNGEATNGDDFDAQRGRGGGRGRGRGGARGRDIGRAAAAVVQEAIGDFAAARAGDADAAAEAAAERRRAAAAEMAAAEALARVEHAERTRDAFRAFFGAGLRFATDPDDFTRWINPIPQQNHYHAWVWAAFLTTGLVVALLFKAAGLLWISSFVGLSSISVYFVSRLHALWITLPRNHASHRVQLLRFIDGEHADTRRVAVAGGPWVPDTKAEIEWEVYVARWGQAGVHHIERRLVSAELLCQVYNPSHITTRDDFDRMASEARRFASVGNLDRLRPHAADTYRLALALTMHEATQSPIALAAGVFKASN